MQFWQKRKEKKTQSDWTSRSDCWNARGVQRKKFLSNQCIWWGEVDPNLDNKRKTRKKAQVFNEKSFSATSVSGEEKLIQIWTTKEKHEKRHRKETHRTKNNPMIKIWNLPSNKKNPVFWALARIETGLSDNRKALHDNCWTFWQRKKWQRRFFRWASGSFVLFVLSVLFLLLVCCGKLRTWWLVLFCAQTWTLPAEVNSHLRPRIPSSLFAANRDRKSGLLGHMSKRARASGFEATVQFSHFENSLDSSLVQLSTSPCVFTSPKPALSAVGFGLMQWKSPNTMLPCFQL